MSMNCSLVRLLLLLVFSSSLMLCILAAATITHLPGFNGALPFHLETGYVSLDEVTQAELFYYFVESERKPSEDPLILWLTGGPGCTSFYGLAREIGPIRFKVAPYNGTLPMLVYNPYAWTKISNVIFLDWPAMTGFSFLRNDESYRADDIKSSKEIYNFLKQWLLDHPHFLSNPFYVGGNSYGGKMVPIVAHKVAEGIGEGQHPLINLQDDLLKVHAGEPGFNKEGQAPTKLKEIGGHGGLSERRGDFLGDKISNHVGGVDGGFTGYICNNPITSTILDINSRVPYAHGMGIISDELFQAIQRSCPGEDYKRPRTGPCIEQIKIFRGFVNELMMDNFLTKKCEGESIRPELSNAAEADRSILKQKSTVLRSPPPIPDIECSTYPSYLAYYWANDNDTRAALHVKEGTVKEWQICRADFPYDYALINSSVPYHHDLIARGYRALVFSGDHDLGVPFLGTMEWIGSLNLSIIEPWRSWHVNGQVGGYTVRYSNNLTYATVKGGGHEPAKDRNMETSALFTRWISHKSLWLFVTRETSNKKRKKKKNLSHFSNLKKNSFTLYKFFLSSDKLKNNFNAYRANVLLNLCCELFQIISFLVRRGE
ncbi:hypothetical protein IEQ34_004032 [Dendrobium chrysotoxum]|uniref:Uncharacterized protein n=1 Tax=Dendrobium chrysotoxum TaxID=161865 RepID=A0AAV7HFA2_DENCH|nr:hypothetical protein IEQ34_004032 [Dendrobium chrysotoxum]